MIKLPSILTKTLPALVIACAMAAFTTGPAAGQTAKKLKCSGCVKSKQIGNNQIKSKDIKDGQVGNADLAGNAVDSAKIVNGSVGNADLASNAVTGAKVENGSLAGADLADGTVGAAKLGLANTTFIDDTGSDIGNCDDLRDALTGLTGPAAVVLGPGTYACGTNPVVLSPRVSLIGSGRNLTTITGSVEGLDGLVRLQGDGIALRGLAVVNEVSAGPVNSFSFAVVVGAGNVDTRDWRISNVTAEAMNSSIAGIGILAGSVDCGGGEMTDVTATASGGITINRGVQMSCTVGSVTGSNLTASASDSVVKTDESSLTLRNSSLSGASFSVFLTGGTLKVISSELSGPVSGDVICVGDYDGAGTALADGTFGSGGCI